MIITINGKEIGIKANNYAVEKLFDLLTSWKDVGGFAEQYAYVYAGFLGWKFVKEEAPGSAFKAPVIDFEEVVEWVDGSQENDETFAQLRQIVDLFKANPLMKKAINEVKKKTEELSNLQANQEQQSTSSPTESSGLAPTNTTV